MSKYINKIFFVLGGKIMEIEDLLPEISNETSYWLVRTQAGEYFEDFLAGHFIGINWDDIINLDLIMNDDKADELVEQIKEKYEDEKRPNHAARQIKQFVKEMKKGDIVIIPSKSSKYIAFGQIIENNIYTENVSDDDIEDGVCPFVKRRKVKWLKIQERNELDPYLYQLLYSHHTITSANTYATYIDRTLNSFYIKDNKAHFILHVNETRNIRAIQMAKLINNNLEIIDLFNELYNENLNKNNVDIKINVQSPGPVEIYGTIKEIAVIGFFIIAVCGGGFKLKAKDIETELKTEGFIEKLIKFRNNEHKNKMEMIKLESKIKESVEEMKIVTPSLDEPSELNKVIIDANEEK